MVCLPSRGLATPCLPLSPHMCAFAGWCVCLPEALSPMVSLLVSLVAWCACLPEALSPLSPSSPSLSPSSSPSWSSFLFPFVGWCEALSPLACLPASSFLCWMACPPSWGLVFLVSQLVSQLVFLLVSLCWVVRHALSLLSPSLSPRLYPSWFSCLSPSCIPICFVSKLVSQLSLVS